MSDIDELTNSTSRFVSNIINDSTQDVSDTVVDNLSETENNLRDAINNAVLGAQNELLRMSKTISLWGQLSKSATNGVSNRYDDITVGSEQHSSDDDYCFGD